MADGIDRRLMIQEALAQMGERKPISNLLSVQEKDAERSRLTQGAAETRSQDPESFAGLDLETILGGQAAGQRGINESDLEELLRQQMLEEDMQRQNEQNNILRELGVGRVPVGQQDPLEPHTPIRR